jgi:hypothetical protein
MSRNPSVIGVFGLLHYVVATAVLLLLLQFLCFLLPTVFYVLLNASDPTVGFLEI